MSIRGGYGVFFDSPQMFFDTRYSNAPPWGQTISLGATSFQNPYSVYGNGTNPFPGLLTLNSATTFVQNGVFVNTPLNLQQMYLQQYNFSIQKQLGRWLFGGSYLGNKTTHLMAAYELNPATYIPGVSTGAVGSCGAMPASVLPKAGVACSSTGNSNARRKLFLQNNAQGGFYSTIGQLDDGGNANYNGMLISVNRRSKTVNLVANYTYAHCLSEAETTELTGPSYVIPGRRDLSYSNCDSDRRHVANMSLILSAPSFKERLVNAVAGGWGLSTIFTARSGGYFTVTSGVDNSLTGIGNQIPLTTGSAYGTRSTFGSQNYLNTASFTPAATGTFTQNRPYTLTGPPSYQLDMALTRDFPIFEAQRVQFRWEVFNVPNEAIFSTPIAVQTSTSFGRITTTAADPRIMQFALKYIF